MLPGGLGQVDHPIEAREGSQVRLECRAEGIPPPIVRWRSPVSNNFNCIGNSDSHMFLGQFSFRPNRCYASTFGFYFDF